MNRNWITLIFGVWCAFLVVGCSSVPKGAAMRVLDMSVPAKLAESIVIHVAGGQDFALKISDSQFEVALRESLSTSGLVGHVVDRADAELRLDVVLGDGAGLETRELTLLWSLSQVPSGEVVWQEFVTSKGRSRHFVGVVRQRRSVEYAAQENIRLGIERLAQIDRATLR